MFMHDMPRIVLVVKILGVIHVDGVENRKDASQEIQKIRNARALKGIQTPMIQLHRNYRLVSSNRFG